MPDVKSEENEIPYGKENETCAELKRKYDVIVVGAGYLMGAVPSTRGPGRTYLWRTSCSARSIAGQLRTDRINAESI